MLEMISGSALFVIVIGCIAAGYCVYMSQLFKDIAHDDAREEADRLFDDYVHNCEFRIHQKIRFRVSSDYERWGWTLLESELESEESKKHLKA